MPSFDIVSEINMQEIDNSVNQTSKEISQRFDFRGTNSVIELDKKEKIIKILANSEQKIDTIFDLLQGKAIKRGLDIKCFDRQKIIPTTGTTLKLDVKLVEGIDKETAKKITTHVKECGLKLQAQIQDEKVRVTGKKRDDLQELMAQLKQLSLERPLQFNNFRE